MRGYLQFSFAWFFAIVVGVFILFLAIFAATRIINTESTQSNTEIAKEISVLINPLETSFQESQVVPISLPTESRIYLGCSEDGEFGDQSIRISQKTFNKWTDPSVDILASNKYIFGEYPVEGKEFYLFSKSFEFPFKIADLIYVVPSQENFCFSGLNELEEVKDELEDLNRDNFFFANCTEQMTKICFSGSTDCDVTINYNLKTVEKNGETVWFEDDALMYGAIFSDEQNYECQLKRLMKRTKSLSELYLDKSTFISTRTNCGTNLDADLMALSSGAEILSSSASLNSVKNIAEEVRKKNDDRGECALW